MKISGSTYENGRPTIHGRIKCPRCGKENTDDWPIDVDGKVKLGGCQDCWENECDEKWWIAVAGRRDE